MSKTEVKTVRMTKPGNVPPSADVHPDEVENMRRTGWSEVVEEKNIGDMSLSELRAYAKDKEIVIPGKATTKDAVYEVIKSAMDSVGE